MKKGKGIVAALLVLAIVTCSITTGAVATASGTTVKGDINGDNLCNMMDALLMYSKLSLAEELDTSADFNHDGIINMFDCLTLYSHVGLSVPWPDEPSTPTTTTTAVQTKPVLSVETVKATAGQQNIQVPVRIQNNPGVLGMTVSVEFNDNLFTLTNATNGSAFSGVLTFTKDKLLNSGCDFSWDGQEINASQIYDGNVMVLNFAAAASVAPGTYDVKITVRDAYDNDILPLSVDVKNGSIVIE